MKTYTLYGFISSLAGAFLTLLLYFAGFHSDPSKLAAAKWIGGLLGIAILTTCVVLGIKARREEIPVEHDFGYWRSFFASFMICAVATVFNLVFTYVYNTFINPGFNDLLLQEQLNKIEASGMSGDKLDRAEGFTRSMFHPVPQAIFFVVISLVIAVVLSLILAGFFTRKAVQPPRL
jgi:hypothetical protein